MTADFTLRPYPGPGKYEGGLAIDEWAHVMTMAGCDDEAGDVAERGEWYGLMRGPFKADGPFADITPVAIAEYGITDDELAYLAAVAGCIVREDNQGFVSVAWYDDAATMERDWAEVDASFADEADDEA